MRSIPNGKNTSDVTKSAF